jgi:hypothetical protein
VGGGLSLSGPSALINTTISGNDAATTGGGFSNAGTLTLTNATITGNYAGNQGGGVFGQYSSATFPGVTNIANTVIAGNLSGGGATENDDLAGNAGATFTFNALTITNTDPANNTNAITDPNLTQNVALNTIFANTTPQTVGGATFPQGELAANGGPVETVALATGANPAIDGGAASLALGVTLDESVLGVDLNGDGDKTDTITNLNQLAYDARGPSFDRYLGAAPDLGAFELI